MAAYCYACQVEAAGHFPIRPFLPPLAPAMGSCARRTAFMRQEVLRWGHRWLSQ